MQELEAMYESRLDMIWLRNSGTGRGNDARVQKHVWENKKDAAVSWASRSAQKP